MQTDATNKTSIADITNTTIGFIGAGNMASALIQGLIADGVKPENILASDRNSDKLAELQKGCAIRTPQDNTTVVREADVIVLAVKPQVMEAVLSPLSAVLKDRPCLLISIAAGITLESLSRWSHEHQALVRCMPNTPALVRCGASALIANSQVSETQQALAGDILQAVGSVVWLQHEQQMDAVTALSGSGPAYFFLLMEAMQMAAVKLGLGVEMANSLCQQTALGAARLACDSDLEVAELRSRVTSPGGTTEAALNQLLSEGFMDTVARALERAAIRSAELSDEN